MVLIRKHYQESDTKRVLVEILNSLMAGCNQKPVFICIGSDRHILDCLGPLTGSMIKEKEPQAIVFGTLDNPVHAKNIGQAIINVKSTYPGRIHIAIDASVGNEVALGTITVQKGAIIPGRALAKSLPPVGDIAITGIVGPKFSRRSNQIFHGSLNHVYHMAAVISDSISQWYNRA
ncbi:MAG: spore protease YyaC [Syntrophomonadaceae bacterium]|jgi:putative sporulation protein YyaC